MPAFTVNRNYPYSIPTDPADVAQALEDLARAVDADVENIADTIGARPLARVRGTTPQSFGSTIETIPLTFALTDLNVGGAIAPLGGTPTTITPLLPGFWWAVGTLAYPTAGASSLNNIGLRLQKSGSNALGSRQNTHVQPPTSDGVRNFCVSMGSFMNGTTDTFALQGFINRASGTATYTVYDRALTIFRMTES